MDADEPPFAVAAPLLVAATPLLEAATPLLEATTAQSRAADTARAQARRLSFRVSVAATSLVVT